MKTNYEKLHLEFEKFLVFLKDNTSYELETHYKLKFAKELIMDVLDEETEENGDGYAGRIMEELFHQISKDYHQNRHKFKRKRKWDWIRK